MIAKELLDILVCPETKQSLKLMELDEVERINKEIKALQLENRGGDKITKEVSGVLVREDGMYGYAIRDGIPIMLIEESFRVTHHSE